MERTQSRATMREVAALAGVSLKTVSRVVNGESGVTDSLTLRVREAAVRLDYRPNLTASSLRRSDGRTRTIGLLLDDIANPFFSSLYRAVEEAATARGVVVLAGSIDQDVRRERELAQAFTARRVEGLIVAPTGPDQSYLATEQRAGTALVFVDRAPALLAADAVVSTNESGARQAVRHLLAHGHSRIAYLGISRSIVTGPHRYAGYVDAMERAGVPLPLDLIVHDLVGSDGAQSALLALLDSADPPTAVFAGQNLITIGAIRALRERGRQHRVAPGQAHHLR